MGDTPICILLDGEGDAGDLVATYGAQVLRVDDVEPEALRRVSRRSQRAKNAALWAAPFETYLLLDCDTVVWGDMRRFLDFDRFDFRVNVGGREALEHVMDVASMQKLFPDFDAAGHVDDFVNSGVYFARRGALDLDRYLQAVELQERNPGVLKFGDQGLFNLMIFRAADEGAIRLDQRELQLVVKDTSREEIVSRFGFHGRRPAIVGEPAVIHWAGGAGAKPKVRERGEDYFAPMTYFRLQYLRDRGRSSVIRGFRLRLEDLTSTDIRSTNTLGAIKRARRRSRWYWARLKVPIRRRIPDWVMATVRRQPAVDAGPPAVERAATLPSVERVRAPQRRPARVGAPRRGLVVAATAAAAASSPFLGLPELLGDRPYNVVGDHHAAHRHSSPV
jgi:hypothetical protein